MSSKDANRRQKGKNTGEYEVVKDHLGSLVSQMEHVFPELANEFFSKNLISRFEYSEATNNARSPYERATKVVNSILSKIEDDTDCFHKLVDVLQESGLQDIADTLVAALNSRHPPPPPPQPSIEYKVVLEHHILLVGVFQSSLSELARELHRKNLIDINELTEARNDIISSLDRARGLVSSIEKQVQDDHTCFEALVSILDEQSQSKDIGGLGSVLMKEKVLRSKPRRRQWPWKRSPPLVGETPLREHCFSVCEATIQDLNLEQIEKNDRIKGLEHDKKELACKKDELAHKKERLEKTLQNLRIENHKSYQEDVEALKKELQAKEAIKSKLEQEMEVLKRAEGEKVEEVKKEYREKVDGLRKELQEKEAIKSKLTDEKKVLEDKVQELKRSGEKVGDLDKKLELVQAKEKKALEELEDIKYKLTEAEREKDRLNFTMQLTELKLRNEIDKVTYEKDLELERMSKKLLQKENDLLETKNALANTEKVLAESALLAIQKEKNEKIKHNIMS